MEVVGGWRVGWWLHPHGCKVGVKGGGRGSWGEVCWQVTVGVLVFHHLSPGNTDMCAHKGMRESHSDVA